MFPRFASYAFGNNKIRVSPVKMFNIDYGLQLEDCKKTLKNVAFHRIEIKGGKQIQKPDS